MNVSISEIMLVLLIALLVVRPEQMPEVALTLGRLVKSIRRVFSKLKDEMGDLIEPVEKNNERQ